MLARVSLSIGALAMLAAPFASAAPTSIYDPVKGISYYTNTTPLNLADAEAAAAAAGGHLISIHSDADNAFVTKFNGAGWIGLNDRAVEGTYVWTDGTPTDYTHWNGGEPNNFGNFENAVEYNGGNWNDNNENTTQSSIAVKPGAIFTAPQANGYKYAVLNVTDYNTAEAQAVALGGHLASVHNATENDFIKSLIPTNEGSVWIGLTDQVEEGTYVWTDGSATDYLNWNGGEPNNAGDEDATELTMAGWNDNQLGAPRFAVVQVAVPEPASLGMIGMAALGLIRRKR